MTTRAAVLFIAYYSTQNYHEIKDDIKNRPYAKLPGPCKHPQAKLNQIVRLILS